MGKYESFPGAAEPEGIEPQVIEPLVIRAEGDTVTIPDAHLLFSGDFSRSGADLVIAGEGRSVVVADYFGDAGMPTLAAPNGAVLLPNVVSALAGPLAPGQYAQADDTQPAQGIGSVVSMTGSATAQRSDGTVVDLTVDSRLAEGDVVQTGSGSALSIVFDDGSVFNLNADCRMVLNELVYEPGGSSNSMLFSMVQGVFAFVAGQVAPTGEMRIDTPAATMGIRGTSGIVKLETVDGVGVFRVIPDPVTNDVGTIVLYSPGTNIILVVMESSDSQWAVDPATGQVIEQPADPGDADLIEQLHQTYIEFAGIPDDPGDTQFAEGGGSGLPTQFSLTPAEIGAIVALAGGALPQIEPLGGEPVVSGVDFAGEPEGFEFEPAPPPPPQPVSSDPQQLPPGGFTGDDFGSVDEDGGSTTTGQLVFAGGTGLIEPLTIQGTYGTFEIDADGNWVYTLDNDSAAVQSLGEGDSAEESFAVVSADGSETQFVTIAVHGVNDVPVAQSDGFATNEHTAVEGNVLADNGNGPDDDVDGDPLTVTHVNGSMANVGTQIVLASGALLLLNDDGSFDYDPNGQFAELEPGDTAQDSFTYTVADGHGGSDEATVSITIAGVIDLVAENDNVNTAEDTPVAFDVLANDGVPGGPELTIVNVGALSDPELGTLEILEGGTFLFTPGLNLSGNTSFTYQVSDGVSVKEATVTIEVAPVADAPTLAVGQSQAIGGDDLSTWSSLGVVSLVASHEDQTPTDGDPMLLLTSSGATDADIESLLGLDSGALDSVGNDDVTEGSVVMTELQVVAGDVVSFDWNFGEKDYLPFRDYAFVTIDGVLFKLAEVNDTEQDIEWRGWQTFSFTAQSTGTLTLGVGVVDVGDTALESELLIANLRSSSGEIEGEANAAIALPIAASLVDNDGSENLSILVAGVPAGAVLSAGSDNGDGTWSLTPEQLLGLTITLPGSTEDFTLAVTATSTEDGNGDTASTSRTLHVVVHAPAVNNAPVATDSLIATNQGVSASGMLTGMDVDSDTATFSLEQGPQNGTVVIDADGSYVYTPDEGVTGQDSFSFRVMDGQGAFDIATVEIEIAGVGELATPKEIAGTTGNDVLIGSALNDFLSGGLGNDFIDGGMGGDDLLGGDGDDHLVSGGARGAFDEVNNTYLFLHEDHLDGRAGDDMLIATGGDVTMVGGPGDDTISSQDDGSDWFDFTRVSYRSSTSAIEVGTNPDGSLTVQDGLGGTDTVSRVHVLYDSAFNDTILVDASYQTSYGNFIEIRLSAGDDAVVFDNVAHARIAYLSAGGGVLADLALGTATDLNPENNFIGTDVFSGKVHVLRGSSFDDQLLGTDGDEAFRGEGGTDHIDGRGGIDAIQFAASETGIHVDLSQNMVLDDGWSVEGGGVDTLVSIENVTGSAFADLIIGDDGSNELNGSLGNDTLIGGLGSDVLIGGDGADRLEYVSPDEGGDSIIDFAVSEDVLVIDATFFGGGLVGGEPLPDSQFVAGDSPTATDPEWGQFLYDTSSGDLFWDSDGTGEGSPVHIANLTGAPALTAADFEIVESGIFLASQGDVTAAVDPGSEPVA